MKQHLTSVHHIENPDVGEPTELTPDSKFQAKKEKIQRRNNIINESEANLKARIEREMESRLQEELRRREQQMEEERQFQEERAWKEREINARQIKLREEQMEEERIIKAKYIETLKRINDEYVTLIENINKRVANENSQECVICGDTPRNAAVIPCGHAMFCYECISEYQINYLDRGCPVCRGPMNSVTKIFT